ncbi:tyrosine-protein phosphatase [Clostridium tarantellae]|nr:tyrosine-protein phosphatase [Clostridium tarantellae]
MVEKVFNKLMVNRIDKSYLKISWQIDDKEEVSIYWNNKPIINGNEKFLINIKENEVILREPCKNERFYFILKCNGYKDDIVSEVRLPLEKLVNFRDLGGIKSKDGKKVKWGVFFRSEELKDLGKNDIEYIESLGLKTILDYRSRIGATLKKDTSIKGAKYISVPAFSIGKELESLGEGLEENFDILALLKSPKVIKAIGNPVTFASEMYKRMIFNNKAYKELMMLIQNTGNLPIDQHCTQGKDRTGVGVAILLLALGVDEELVVKDYLASNKYRKIVNDEIKQSIEKSKFSKEEVGMLDIVMKVREEYIRSSIKAMKEKYGSINMYLEKEYGLTEEKLQKLKNEYLY